jgi:hypothetical protein
MGWNKETDMTASKTDKPAEGAPAATTQAASTQAASPQALFEGEIREFVRRDVAPWRRRGEGGGESTSENVNHLVQRVAGASMTEIDNVIVELQTVREILRQEGERVQREVSGYANLSQAAMASMKIIAESMAQWRGTMNQHSTHAPPRD